MAAYSSGLRHYFPIQLAAIDTLGMQMHRAHRIARGTAADPFRHLATPRRHSRRDGNLDLGHAVALQIRGEVREGLAMHPVVIGDDADLGQLLLPRLRVIPAAVCATEMPLLVCMEEFVD